VLQQRYPSAAYSVGMSDVEIPHDALVAARDVFITHYSSIELAEEDSVATFRTAPQRRKRLRLITIGSLAQMYKGTDVLIRAAAKCLAAGMDFDLAIVGDGKCRRELEQLAEDLGISRHVHFLGQLPAGEAVREQLDKADLFVLPSRCEGLPRAMIEAMARALPCIGSAVGGIPELLVDEHMTPPGDVVALAAKIREVLDSPARMSAMSVRNLAIAQEYRDGILDERRTAFYEHIRRSTAEWLVRTSASERHDHESQDHRLRHEQYVRRSPVSPRSSVERARARV
jgi:glycosyltransferase involved in cell wall biosynthesis